MVDKPDDKLIEAINWHRNEFQLALDRFVADSYVIETTEHGDKFPFLMRRMEVYRRACREFLIRVPTIPFQKSIMAAVERAGGICTMYTGRKCFANLRLREICREESLEKTAAFKSECHKYTREGPVQLGRVLTSTRQLNWEELLEKEGLPSELRSVGFIDPGKVDINSSRIEKATEAYWRLHRDSKILKLYIEGFSIRDIESLMKLGRKLVWNRLKHYGLTS